MINNYSFSKTVRRYPNGSQNCLLQLLIIQLDHEIHFYHYKKAVVDICAYYKFIK